MDLEQANGRLTHAQQRYLRWRDVLQELREEPASSDLGGALAAECADLLEDEEDVATWRDALSGLESMERVLKDELRSAREDAWYEQGKVLRYAMVVVENRIAVIEEELGESGDEQALRLLEGLRSQVGALGSAIASHDGTPPTSSLICSPAEIRTLIDNKQHIAEKEALEAILERAMDSELSETQPCIHLSWNAVTGAWSERR